MGNHCTRVKVKDSYNINLELTHSDIPGPRGDSGFSGFSGYSGQGYSGFSGTPGASGYSGQSGQSGSQGEQGFSGASGFSGYSGAVGVSGYSGYSGSSGQRGERGESGLSGFSGLSGMSGKDGVMGSSFTLEFTQANLADGILTVIHNLGTKYVSVVSSDNTDNMVFPGIEFVNTSTVRVDFGVFSPITGIWRVTCINGGVSGYSGVSGQNAEGTTNHAALTNLDYDTSGHTGFQKKMVFDLQLGCYTVE